MKVSRVLVPTDFSEDAFRTFQFAVDFVGEFEPEIVLVHVIEPLPLSVAHWSEPTELLEHHAETALGKLEQFQKRAQQVYTNCRCDLHFGEIHEVLEELVAKLKADLVVIWMHEQTHFLDLLARTTAERILRHVSCPVLRIRIAADSKVPD